jgi:hypothetical protein
MAHSQVPKVVLNSSGNIDLTVQVIGFAIGMSVEIYGYVSQDGGAFASFRENRKVPPPDPDGIPRFKITIKPNELQLTEGQPVTVLTWVSEFWPSMLIVDESNTTPGVEAAWAIDQAASDRWTHP